MKQKWHESPWKPKLNWGTEGGLLLKRCVEVLAAGLQRPPRELIVFGSIPLQMGVSESFLSGEVDIATREQITPVLGAHGMLQGQSDPYVEVSAPDVFVASTDWQSRAYSEEVCGIALIFPHPIDILVSKVNRCEEKDICAFLEVISQTGHPTEAELKESLQRVVDIYRPTFDEEGGTNALLNTQTLWERLFRKPIDVRAEIIAPALERKRRSQETSSGETARRALRRLRKPGVVSQDGL